MIASLCAAAAALAGLGLSATPAAPAELSVMSYNVHGVPWPIALGRPKAMSEIGARLAQMRAAGNQPHLVLLQEAFTPDAKAIARRAGYAYVVNGPAGGAVEDSGLMILSDYPIIGEKKIAYSRCAGYDCLADKGALMVRVAVPGAEQPVTIFDTHLNSRKESGVSVASADAAYGWQAQRLREFVRENAPEGSPAILAGDFNIGHRPYRIAMITGGGGTLGGGVDALRELAGKTVLETDAQAIVKHAKDWMFGRDGSSTKLRVKSVTVPFGREPEGKSLSDHFGYVVHYAVADYAAAARGGSVAALTSVVAEK